MGSPRVDVVFRLWQCDKENHGWREGPPRPVPAKVTICCRAFTLRQRQFRTKKEYRSAMLAASPHSEHWPVYSDNPLGARCNFPESDLASTDLRQSPDGRLTPVLRRDLDE